MSNVGPPEFFSPFTILSIAAGKLGGLSTVTKNVRSAWLALSNNSRTTFMMLGESSIKGIILKDLESGSNEI